jgi:membrane-associated phospholipid phosphatase
MLVSLSPTLRAAVLVALFLALLVALAVAWRWFGPHRQALWRAAARGLRSLAASKAASHLRERYPRLWRALVARLTPQHYLGLHLTVGLALSASALLFFGTVAEGVLDREMLAVFDDSVTRTLRANATPRGTTAVAAFTRIGGVEALFGLALVVAILLALARKRTLVTGWLAALLGAGVLDQALKPIFRRPRPEGALEMLRYESWSFPSGHAMASLIAYGMLAYIAILFVRSHVLRQVIVASALLLVLGIGFSRLYLGVHYFTDVVGGFAAGVVWLSACISGLEVARRRRILLESEPVSEPEN